MSSPSFTAPPTHFLSQARASLVQGPRHADLFDVSTVAAADYDIDVRSGFMPPAEPVARLLGEFSVWEDILDAALGRLQLAADLVDASEGQRRYVAEWRTRVKQVRAQFSLGVLPILARMDLISYCHLIFHRWLSSNPNLSLKMKESFEELISF